MGKPAKIFIVLLGIMLLFTVISRSAASFTVAQVRVEQPQARKIEHKVTGDGTIEKLLDQDVILIDGTMLHFPKYLKNEVRKNYLRKRGDF